MNNLATVLASRSNTFTVNYPTVYVTDRPPTVKDDGAHGLAAGQFWQYNGNVWYCDDSTTNAATWTLQSPVSGKILDVVPVALGAYGVFLLRTGYSGKAFQVLRASDSATLDIDFVTGVADWTAVDAFIAATTGTIAKWYDQSGNGYDLAPPTGQTGPTVTTVTVNGFRCISFSGLSVTKYLLNLSMPITNVRNVTIAMIGNVYWGQVNNVLYELGNPTAALTQYVISSSGLQYGNMCGATSPEVIFHATNGASAQAFYQNDVTGGTNSAPPSAAATGITLCNGLGYGSYPGGWDGLAFVIYDSSLSAPNKKLLLQSSYTVSGIQPQRHDVFAMCGDSITQGNTIAAGATNSTMYSRQMQAQIARPFTYFNLGFGGQTASGQAASASTVSGKCFHLNGRNYASIFIGTNDLAANVAPATCYASILSIIAAYRNNGYTKFAVSTILPRGATFTNGQNSAGFEADRITLNALIRAGAGVDFDTLVDVGGDATIGVPATYLTPTYSFDNIHPTVLSQGIITGLFATALNTMVA